MAAGLLVVQVVVLVLLAGTFTQSVSHPIFRSLLFPFPFSLFLSISFPLPLPLPFWCPIPQVVWNMTMSEYVANSPPPHQLCISGTSRTLMVCADPLR